MTYLNPAETDEVIRFFRREQEALFFDAATVVRRTGEPTYNPTTGQVTSPIAAVYSGPCSITTAAMLAFGTDVTVGETEVRLIDWQAKFPVDTPIAKNDLLTVTASRYDQGWVGMWFRIKDVMFHGRQVSRVAVIEDLGVAPDDIDLGAL